MSDAKDTGKKTKIDDLDVSKETVQDLSESQAEGVEGGARPNSAHNSCAGQCNLSVPPKCG